MQLIVFSKAFRDRGVSELIGLAHRYGFEGYDLCVRPGYAVDPDNAHQELPAAVSAMRQDGLGIPMVTGNFDLLTPDHPTAEPILAAMDQADVRLLKLGYFEFDPAQQNYWQVVDDVRKALAGWQELGRKYGVKICYHTHSGVGVGVNCASLMHLIGGFDPQFIGAYIDPGHMVKNGEEFELGVAMVKQYLSIIGLKDVALTTGAKNGHGTVTTKWVPAGEGMVDWTDVFAELQRVGFDGPLSVHCEFEVPEGQFYDVLAREITFFKQHRDLVLSENDSSADAG